MAMVAPINAPDVRPEELMTYDEACERLGVKQPALKAAIGRGRLHPLHIRGIRGNFLYRAEVEAYRDRRPWLPVPSGEGASMPDRRSMPAPVSERSSMMPAFDASSISERVEALSGPILAAVREMQVTNREVISGLVSVAVAAGIGASGAQIDPKR